MENLYLSEYLEEIEKHIVIEGDEHTIYAYLLNNDAENTIILSGFVCSRGTLVDSLEAVETYLEKGFAPVLAKPFANEFSVEKEVKAEDIDIDFEDNAITVTINHIIFLVIDLEQGKSFSLGLAEEGPYGFPLGTGQN